MPAYVRDQSPSGSKHVRGSWRRKSQPAHRWRRRLQFLRTTRAFTARPPAFTRFNVFLRDQWTCQYCGDQFRTHELTFDHVIPRSRGGKTSWGNIVTACQECNLQKGSQLPRDCGMFPLNEPHQPSVFTLQDHGRRFPPNFLHESWGDFLYWDTELVD